MKENRYSLKIFSLALLVIELPILVNSIHHVWLLGIRNGSGWLLLIPVIIGLAYVGTVKIPGSKASLNITDTVIFVGLIAFGVYPAVILALTDALIHSTRTA